mgnify:CR=1 FL=1
MHDYDSEFVFDYENSCHDFIDESTSYEYENTYDLNEDYNSNHIILLIYLFLHPIFLMFLLLLYV